METDSNGASRGSILYGLARRAHPAVVHQVPVIIAVANERVIVSRVGGVSLMHDGRIQSVRDRRAVFVGHERAQIDPFSEAQRLTDLAEMVEPLQLDRQNQWRPVDRVHLLCLHKLATTEKQPNSFAPKIDQILGFGLPNIGHFSNSDSDQSSDAILHTDN